MTGEQGNGDQLHGTDFPIATGKKWKRRLFLPRDTRGRRGGNWECLLQPPSNWLDAGHTQLLGLVSARHLSGVGGM